MSIGGATESLSKQQLTSILETLEMCGSATNFADYKQAVVSQIREQFHFRDVTFFSGPTFSELFSDPDPLLTGDIVSLLDEYREQWKQRDVFTSPEARRMFGANQFASLDELRAIPAAQRSYVEEYLLPHRMEVASALHLRLADGEALVGMFDCDRTWNDSDRMAVHVLARHLNAVSRHLSTSSEPSRTDTLDQLTPRQLEVATLVSEGLTNLEIARVLSISEAAVKKHISRSFGVSGFTNRSSLTAAVLRRKG